MAIDSLFDTLQHIYDYSDATGKRVIEYCLSPDDYKRFATEWENSQFFRMSRYDHQYQEFEFAGIPVRLDYDAPGIYVNTEPK